MELLSLTLWAAFRLCVILPGIVIGYDPEPYIGQVRHQQIFEGHGAILYCTPPKVSGLQMSWTGPDEELLTEGTRTLVNSSRAELTFSKYSYGAYVYYDLKLFELKKEDSGLYTCTMDNHGEIKMKTYNLSVLADDEIPGCTDRKGHNVKHKEKYRPYKEKPCVECMCFNGKENSCGEEPLALCEFPTCPDFERSKDECCEYTCIEVPPAIETAWELSNEGKTLSFTCKVTAGWPEPTRVWSKDGQELPDTDEELVIELGPEAEGMYWCYVNGSDPPASQYFVVGNLAVQQVGPRNAIAHVKMPTSYDEELHGNVTFDIHYLNDETGRGDVLGVKERSFAMLYDLDLNVDYRLQVYPDSSDVSGTPVFTQYDNFNLKLRSSTGLHISDALGRVEMLVKGSSFHPIDSSSILELSNFDIVRISTHVFYPCTQKECGRLDFRNLNSSSDGMILVFLDERDFIWAKMFV